MYTIDLYETTNSDYYNLWKLTFDPRTATEKDWDYLKIYTRDDAKTLLYEKSGTEW